MPNGVSLGILDIPEDFSVFYLPADVIQDIGYFDVSGELILPEGFPNTLDLKNELHGQSPSLVFYYNIKDEDRKSRIKSGKFTENYPGKYPGYFTEKFTEKFAGGCYAPCLQLGT